MESHKYFRPLAVCFKIKNIELKPTNTLLFRVPRSLMDMTRSIAPIFLPSYNIVAPRLPSIYELYVRKLSKGLEGKTELVLAHFGSNAPYAIRLAKNLKVPLFVYFYGYDVMVLLKKCPKYYKYIEKDIKAGFVISNYLYNKLLECNFNRPVHLNRLGLDLIQYKFNPECSSLSDRKTVNIVSVGRLVEFKGHEYLIAAHKMLVRKGYSVKTTIIGDGPRRDFLSNIIEKLAVNDTVKLVGALSHKEVLRYLYDSNIFVFPSVLCRDGRTEALGYACVEAMACGLPVIASNVGGIPEYIINNQTGLLVEQRSPGQIAEAVEELINNPKKAKKLASNARKLVEEMFNISENVCQLELTLLKYILT